MIFTVEVWFKNKLNARITKNYLIIIIKSYGVLGAMLIFPLNFYFIVLHQDKERPVDYETSKSIKNTQALNSQTWTWWNLYIYG